MRKYFDLVRVDKAFVLEIFYFKSQLHNKK